MWEIRVEDTITTEIKYIATVEKGDRVHREEDTLIIASKDKPPRVINLWDFIIDNR